MFFLFHFTPFTSKPLRFWRSWTVCPWQSSQRSGHAVSIHGKEVFYWSLSFLVILISCLHVWNLYINFEFRSHLFFKQGMRGYRDTFTLKRQHTEIWRFFLSIQWQGGLVFRNAAFRARMTTAAASMSRFRSWFFRCKVFDMEIDAGYCHRGREWQECEMRLQKDQLYKDHRTGYCER